MSRVRALQIAGSVLAIGTSIGAGFKIAEHFQARELIWLVAFIPAFIATFFWIVILMVSLFIQADSYKDPRAIGHAVKFLYVFERFFVAILALLTIAAVSAYLYFKS